MLISGITNELLIFQIKLNKYDENKFYVESTLPTTYGFSEKKIFHSAVLYENKMMVYGGLTTDFLIMEIPFFVTYEVEESLKEYEKNST